MEFREFLQNEDLLVAEKNRISAGLLLIDKAQQIGVELDNLTWTNRVRSLPLGRTAPISQVDHSTSTGIILIQSSLRRALHTNDGCSFTKLD